MVESIINYGIFACGVNHFQLHVTQNYILKATWNKSLLYSSHMLCKGFLTPNSFTLLHLLKLITIQIKPTSTTKQTRDHQ